MILLCLVLSPYLIYLRVLPCEHVHLLAKVDSSKEAYVWVDITYYGVVSSPFLTFKEPFCVVVVLQSLSGVGLFVTPWTAARQASLSITNSWSLLKLMSIKLVMPSNHLILC